MHENLIEQAFSEISPDKPLLLIPKLKYSGKFRGYNANVKMTRESITFSLSRNWKPVSPDIKIGLIQGLLVKILKLRGKKTMRMDFYENFLKNVHYAVPKTLKDPVLEQSFQRNNDRYFLGFLDKPNLRWGQESTSRLGTYDFGTDTITISQIIKSDPQLLDYVMYHEMLHKKHKFNAKNGKTHSHTPQFREDERKFEGHEELERQLNNLCRTARLSKRRFWFF